MKHERMTICLCAVSVLMGSLISFSCLMCLAQTYSLPCEPGMLIAVCCLTSGVAAAAMCLKKSWMVTLGVFSIYLIVMIWQNDLLAEGVSTLLYHVTFQFEKCFRNVPVIGLERGDVRLLMAALAIPLSWLTVWTICRESYGAFVIVACLPFLCLSLIVVNLAPNLWLVLLSAELLLLIMSDSVRTRDAHGGSVLIGWLSLPLAAMVIILVCVSPAETYERSEWSQMLQKVAEKRLGVDRWRKKGSSQITVHKTEQTVDLSSVGPRDKNGKHALRYYSGDPVSYLRGISYSWYENGAWENFANEVYEKYDVPEDLLTCNKTSSQVQVETSEVHDVIYTPYYPSALPEESAVCYDICVQNMDGSVQYTLGYSPSGMIPEAHREAYENLVYEIYALVPQELASPLYEILRREALVGATPQEIADFVRELGEYELNTPAVPEGEDFVLYFLNESHQGYCVHFASATTLLLKAQGVPARYVTGYAADGPTGKWNDVSEDDAHAWVEYYEEGVGWQVLDPTPSQWREGDIAQPHEPEEKPEEPGKEPHEPEEKPEKPEQPERPDEPTQTPQSEQPQEQTDAQSGQNSAARNAEAKEEHTSKEPIEWYWWLLCIPGLVAVIVLRRLICLSMAKMRRKKAEPNRKALLLWLRLVRLYKADKEKVPEEVVCLAEKAKFSQHTLSEEEVLRLETAMKERIVQMKKHSLPRRLWHQYGLVLY